MMIVLSGVSKVGNKMADPPPQIQLNGLRYVYFNYHLAL